MQLSWRSIFLSSPATVNVRYSQLHIQQNEEITIPLEDIGAIMIESNQITITTAALSSMSTHGIATFVCDQRHLPCGVLIPFLPHSRQWKVLKAQLEISKPLAKQCWRQIIEQKINNQASCLDYLGKDDGDMLREIALTVKSGDSTNREAYAARIYFQRLLETFRRRDDTVINSALNYGYAIFRGTLARTLAVYGFNPAIGIHHSNELNAFNLADDFIEIFRPVVDLWVSTQLSPDTEKLTIEDRANLLGILYLDMEMGSDHKSAIRCIEEMVGGFSTTCHQKSPKFLTLPNLLPIATHKNE